MILSSMILYAMILNAMILDCVNKPAPTQLAHTTVPVAVTITLLMTYTTAWVCVTVYIIHACVDHHTSLFV